MGTTKTVGIAPWEVQWLRQETKWRSKQSGNTGHGALPKFRISATTRENDPSSPAPKAKKTTAAERRSMSSSLAARVASGVGSQVELHDQEYEAEKTTFQVLLSSLKIKRSWYCEDCTDSCKKKGRGALRGDSGNPKHFVCKACQQFRH